MASRTSIIEQEAQRAGIPPSLLYGVWGAESNFGHNKGPSSAGALGDFQLMPGTARGLGVRLGNFRSEARGAAKYLAQYKGRGVEGMLAAYNAGPAGNPHNAETQAYIPKVQEYAKRWSGEGLTGGPGGLPSAMLSTTDSPAQPLPEGQGLSEAMQLLLGQQQRPVIQSAGIAAPAFSARPVLAQGAQVPQGGGGPAQQGPDVNALLALVAAQGQGATVDPAAQGQTTTATIGGAGQAAPGGGRISPRAKPGDPVVSSKQSEGGLHQTAGLAGYPAHDFFAPAGTHAVAPVSGTVVKLSGNDPSKGAVQGAGGPLGWSTYIRGDDGKTYFLTHMGSRNVKVGQKVRQGQVIGTVADYDKYGRPSHIHLGVSG